MERVCLLLGALFFCVLFPQGTCHTYKWNNRIGKPVSDIVKFNEGHGWLDLERCDDLPAKRNLMVTNLNVTGNIMCSTPKIIIVNAEHQVTIQAEHDLVLSGIQFHVEIGSRLNLVAGGVILLMRSPAMGPMPVLVDGGELVVWAGKKRVPPESKSPTTLLLEPEESQLDLLKRGECGTTYYPKGQEVAFSGDTITIADEVDRAMEFTPVQEEKPANNRNRWNIPDNLKEGYTLREGSLMSTDGTFELWVSIRGSLMFARYVLKDGKEISMELTELIRADPSEVSKMLRVRAKLLEEAAGGRTANLRRYNVFRWTPWGRRYDRRVNAARMHGGEVAMTVDDVGCLEVTVDGSCVLSKSGSHRWEWLNKLKCRRNSSGYCIRVVETGMEVQVRNEKVWGVALPETKAEKPSEGRSVFGMRVEDIFG